MTELIKSFVFGDQPVIDPVPLWQALTSQRIPTDRWWGKANSYRCPLGCEPGRGWLLMRQEDLDKLDLNESYDLTFSCLYESRKRSEITIKNLLVERVCNLAPTLPAQLQSMRLVEIVDWRALAKQIPIDKAYNLRAYPGGALEWSQTLNAGSPWSWDEMVEDIWTINGELGAYPGLGFTPDEPPEDWEFWQMSSLDALCLVLDKLNSKLRWNPVDDTFDIVVIGADDPDLTDALARWRELQVWDEETSESAILRYPEKVRVLFPRHPREFWESLWYQVEVADTDPVAGTLTGTRKILYDDLPAVYDCDGNLTNTADLATRAAERAADYYLSLHQGSEYLVDIFHAAVDDLLPGPQVEAVAWEDRGLGTRTTVYRSRKHLPSGLLPYTKFDRKARIVRVSGARNGSGYYPGYVRCFDPGPPADWVDGEIIWIRQAGDEDADVPATDLPLGDYVGVPVQALSSRRIFAVDAVPNCDQLLDVVTNVTFDDCILYQEKKRVCLVPGTTVTDL